MVSAQTDIQPVRAVEKLPSSSASSTSAAANGPLTTDNDIRTPQKQTSSQSTQPQRPSAGARRVTGAERGKPRHFAPLRLPLRRRLQTAAVLYHTISIAFWLAVFLFVCSAPLLWPVLFVYTVWMWLDPAPENGHPRRIEAIRRLKMWHWYNEYFPLRLHKTHDIDPGRRYIFGYHPHGIISLGAMGAIASPAAGWEDLFPGIHVTLLTLASNFTIPFYRDWAMAVGLASVSRRSCQNLLRRGKGRAIAIVVGGAQESLLSRPNHNALVLKKRLGMFKIALREGADVVPIYAFGENDCYRQVDNTPGTWLYTFQQVFKKVAGFTLPMFHARGVLNYDFGLMPYRTDINVVVGKPIRVERKIADPTEEEALALQKAYIQELQRIWDDFKDDFAPNRESELELVE